MFLPDLVVRGRRVVADGIAGPRSIHVRRGKIIGVVGFGDVPAGCIVDDVGDAAILPRPIDIGAGEYRTPTPLVVISTSERLNSLFQARREGARITGAASMKSLCVVANDQERRDREFLWAALARGMIQLVVGPMSLATLWKEARARGYALEQLAEWTARNPAQAAGLARKGKIEAGFDADLVVFDTDRPAVEREYLRGRRMGP